MKIMIKQHQHAQHPISIAPTIISNEHLLDVAVLSYEIEESICGDDTRLLIKDTCDSPYCCICSLTIIMNDDTKYVGSGWIASFSHSNEWYNNVIMTSGHCVFIRGDKKQFAKEIIVTPGRNGSLTPYGSFKVGVNALRASKQWMSTGDSDFDYGSILVSKSQIDNLGAIGWADVSSSDIEKMTIINTGYPADKSPGTMWTANGPVIQTTEHKILYMNDTYGGQSGSPAYSTYQGQLRVVGIHGYGGCPNKAVRLTKNVIDDMLNWAKDVI